MSVTIKEVKSKKDMNKFIEFSYKLYKGNQYWVPPPKFDERNTLLKEKNPAFDFCIAKYWLAYKHGRVAGRIAGIINNAYVEKWGQKHARFGWIDFINDDEVVSVLMSAVEVWAKDNGMTSVHGPLGFTDMDREGMLVEGFNELGTLATIYNYEYYPMLIENLGYKKDADWIEMEINVPNIINERVERIAKIAEKKSKLNIVRLNKSKDVLPYAKDIFELLNTAYGKLYGFVPLTEKQIKMYTKQYFGFVRPDFITLVKDSENKLAAFGITMPSLSKALQKANGKLLPFGFLHLLKAMKKNDRADLYLVAVRPDLQGKGVNAVLINEMNKIYVSQGIRLVETNPELELNHDVQGQWKYFDYRQHKRRRCYIKNI
ncbi:MAG: GNAT family N-acetyltransferase [Elusimicrobiota bacterium]